MRRIYYVFITITLLLVCFTVGCSTTATLNTVQTSNAYPNKIQLHALVYIPSELQTRVVTATPSTLSCSVWKAELKAGLGYTSAIENGLSSALEFVKVVDTIPTHKMLEEDNFDLLVNAVLSHEDASIIVNEAFFSLAINTQFQTSITLDFFNRKGQLIYSYTANGSGFGDQSGSCFDIAPALKTSMETAMKQVADYIAQSTFGSAQIQEYEKSNRQPKVSVKQPSPIVTACHITTLQAQNLLKESGYKPGNLAGILDERTQIAIEQFQQDRGLPITQKLDEDTQKDFCQMLETSRPVVSQYHEQIMTFTEEIAEVFSKFAPMVIPYFKASTVNYTLLEEQYHSTITNLHKIETRIKNMDVPPYKSCQELHDALIAFVQYEIKFANTLGGDMAMYMEDHTPGTSEDIQFVGKMFRNMLQQEKEIFQKVIMRQQVMKGRFTISTQD